MNMSYSTTDRFTNGPFVSGNLAKPIDLTQYREVCSKSLRDIRKEMDMKKKRKTDKKVVSDKNISKNTAAKSTNIVENAIGTTSTETLNALDQLKAKKSKDSTNKIQTKKPSAEAVVEVKSKKISAELVVTAETKNVTVTEPKKEKDTPANYEAKSTEQFTGTDVFDREEASMKEESKGIDIVDFLHQVTALEQVQAFADVLLDCEFFISHTENNGAALYSEIVTCLDRITNSSKHLLDFVCENIHIYQKSLVDITDLCIKHCGEEPADAKLVATLEKLKICMR